MLDAGVLIGFLNSRDAHAEQAWKAIRALAERRERLLVSSVTYSEALVAPHRAGSEAVARAEQAIDAMPRMEVIAVDRVIARFAASLRSANKKLRTPDAIVLATAGRVGAERILTTDHGLDRFAGTSRLSDFVSETFG